MAIYCFECGVEVSESQKVVRNDRVYCSQAHSTPHHHELSLQPQRLQCRIPRARPRPCSLQPVRKQLRILPRLRERSRGRLRASGLRARNSECP